MEHNKNDPAFVATADAAAGALESATGAADEPHGDLGSGLDFDPVAVAWRSDGWTPAKQRGFIEALADCGVVREAAARVGMSERSANYLRRRDGAASFGRAWDMAIQLGTSRLGSVAYERAVLGTVKPHFYRGRVVGEERVYDNRLLLSLLAKADKLVDPVDVSAVLADWDGWMDAIEHGLDAPRPRAAPTPRQVREKAEAGRDAYFARLRGVSLPRHPVFPEFPELRRRKKRAGSFSSSA